MLKNISDYLIKIGVVFLTIGGVLLIFIFYPILFQEAGYFVKKSSNKNVNVVTEPEQEETTNNYITAVDKDFSIVIPKIGANSKVISNVDPFNRKEYQRELTKGVAHAKGSVFPGQIGNSFLFAHSSDNFFNAQRYNSVFYLLNKLNKGDEVYAVYKDEIYTYKVAETKIVDADQVKYINSPKSQKTLTLMTCWPPGTTLKRYLVIAEL